MMSFDIVFAIVFDIDIEFVIAIEFVIDIEFAIAIAIKKRFSIHFLESSQKDFF